MIDLSYQHSELRLRMSRTAKLYEVCIYIGSALNEKDMIRKEYKTYTSAINFAIKQTTGKPDLVAEVLDLSTDRNLYMEDICASQEYRIGTLWRDGLDVK